MAGSTPFRACERWRRRPRPDMFLPIGARADGAIDKGHNGGSMMQRLPFHRVVLAAAVLTLCLAGCASAGGSGGGRMNDDRITQDELTELQQLDALQVVQRLRPAWLRRRAGSLPRVVLNGVSLEGGTEALRNFRVGEIREMEYLDPSDATMRLGTGYPAGAIIVTTGR